MTQPAVSLSLRRLRELYDDELFIRTNNGVHPTLTAQDIYPALLQANKAFNSTLPEQRFFDPATCKRVFSITALSIVNFIIMPTLAGLIRFNAPGITLDIHPLFSEDLLQDLRSRRFDLAIDLHLRDTRAFHQQLLFEDTLMVVCSRNHPRIREQLSLEQYFDERHVIHTHKNPQISHLEQVGINALQRRKVAWRAAGIIDILPIIAGSEWLATIPSKVAKHYADRWNLQQYPLPFEARALPIYMSWHPALDHDKAHSWLRQQLINSVKEDDKI